MDRQFHHFLTPGEGGVSAVTSTDFPGFGVAKGAAPTIFFPINVKVHHNAHRFQ